VRRGAGGAQLKRNDKRSGRDGALVQPAEELPRNAAASKLRPHREEIEVRRVFRELHHGKACTGALDARGQHDAFRVLDVARDAHRGPRVRKPVSMSSRDICASSLAASILANCRRQSLICGGYRSVNGGTRDAAGAHRAALRRRRATLRLREGVEYALHVLVLLELVDEREHFGGLVLRQLHGLRAHILMLRGERRDVARFERFLQLAEIGKRAVHDELGLAFVIRALAHLFKPVVDEVELEIILIDARGRQAKDAHLLEEEADAAVGGEIAAIFADEVPTPATVRVGLSVAVSTKSATPCGA
jgi:hypothetical protein